MRYAIYIIVLTVLLLAQGCEDPIEVTLDEAPALVTIDAWLADDQNNTQIRLTLSQNYFDSARVQGIDEASVTVTSSDGNVYNFVSEAGTGNYNLPDNGSLFFTEPVGTSYDLDVVLNGVAYTATTIKNAVPPIDSIQQELRINEPFIADGVYCNFFATDLPGVGDTYWIKTFKDGEFLNEAVEINIAFDSAFGPGAEVDNLVFIQPIQELNNELNPENFAQIPWEVGEEIRVEIHSISNEAFFFWEVLRDELQNSNNGIFATPAANTPTNITTSDGSTVIGFFNVASVSSQTDTIR